MGYGSELLAEMQAEAMIHEIELERQVESGTWIQKDGTTINIREMSDRHIRNCIGMLEKKSTEYAEMWIGRFERELSFRDYVKRIASGQLDG